MRRALFRSVMVALCAAVATVSGCAGTPPPRPAPVPGSQPALPAADARLELAGRAAAAKDVAHIAAYTLSQPGRAERTVLVTLAADRTWRVDIPGGALGGAADVAMAGLPAGVFQCALTSASNPSGTTCVRVAGPQGRVSARFDPRVQHVFTDWVDVLTDRRAPLSVSASRRLPRAEGDCYAVESTSASLSAPLDVGIYCFTAAGVLTAARLTLGTLVLAGQPAPAPPTVDLPGPVVAGQPLGMASPPAPPPAPSGSATP